MSDYEELRDFLESHLSATVRDALDISYHAGTTVKFAAFGYRFRLGRDEYANWTLASDEDQPRLLDRCPSDRTFEQWLLRAIANHTH